MESYGKLRKNVPKESNSMNKFVREFSEKKNDGEFLKAQDMLAPNTSQFPNLSKLSLKRQATQKLAPIFDKENYSRSKRKPSNALKPSGEIEYLPVPLAKKPLLAGKSETVPSTQPKVESRKKPGRELVVITGNVQFVLKTFKLYPDLRALYEVYGNILKMHKGKIRFEYIIIMRSQSGPVLQGFYFDFTDMLRSFNPASSIRCVGQFTSQNRFHIHKIEELSTAPPETVLSRIQNVAAFALLQAQRDRPK